MTSSTTADVIVVGGGIVGLAIARELARGGASVLLSAPEHPGTSSSAGAGVLAPTIDPHPDTAFEFAVSARDAFPAFSREIQDETGIDVHLSLTGVLRVALEESQAAALRDGDDRLSRWLDASDVASLEPALEPCIGARFHEHDGIVANERVHSALRASVRAHRRIRWSGHAVGRIDAASSPAVSLTNGTRWQASKLVLAAGAWTPLLSGARLALGMWPGRGQSISLYAPGLTRAVFTAAGYLTPRADGRVYVGATLENAGFDVTTTDEAIDEFRRLAARLLGRAGRAEPLARWAGIRPMTDDRLPLLGPDRENGDVIYATGHSKNGILMGPLTGTVVARLCRGESPGYDLTPFRPDRFDAGPRVAGS